MKIKPSKIICVGLNYTDHAKELNMKIPDEPIIFMKPPSSIIYQGKDIIYPKGIGQVDYEAELAIVIGRGFICLNDITARDLQKKDGQWTRAKSFDTFCPIGPEIVRNIDPDNVKIELRLNGVTKQSSHTSNFIFSAEKIVKFVSNIMTLEKDDIISTGTPAGVGPIKPGDLVEVEIEGIGILKNRVR